MKKTSILFLAFIFCALSNQAQNGSVRALADFDAIIFNASGNIVINQGDVNAVRLDGDEATKDKAVIEVRNGKLYIDKLNGRNTAYITFVDLSIIESNGTGNINSSGIIKTDYLKIENNGAGKATLNVGAKDAIVDLSGVGKVTLSGTAEKLNADISGTGSIEASKLVVSKVNADISGIGNLHVDVKDELAVNISGKGSVRYVTPPKIINKDISGLGSVSNKNSGGGDTTKITIGGSEIIIIDKNSGEDSLDYKFKPRQNKESVKPFWGGIEMGFNGYVNADNETTLPAGYKFLELDEGKSIAFNINFFEKKIVLEKDHLWLVTGLGLNYNNYRFAKKDFKLVPEANTVTALFSDSVNTFNFDKSKLVVSYVTVPLLLQVNTSKSKRNNVHLSTGAIFAYKLGAHTKYVTKDGSRKKEKERDDFNLDPIRLDATVRLGYRNFNLFANYAVTELFKNNEGPELHPYTFGITLIGW